MTESKPTPAGAWVLQMTTNEATVRLEGGTAYLTADDAHGGWRVALLLDLEGSRRERLGRFHLKSVMTPSDILANALESAARLTEREAKRDDTRAEALEAGSLPQAEMAPDRKALIVERHGKRSR